MTDETQAAQAGASRAEGEQADLNQSNTPLYGRGGELDREWLAELADRLEHVQDRQQGTTHLGGELRSYKVIVRCAVNALRHYAALSHPCREVTEEEIARIIEPEAFAFGFQPEAGSAQNDVDREVERARTKARAILAALSSPLGDKGLVRSASPSREGSTEPATASLAKQMADGNSPIRRLARSFAVSFVDAQHGFTMEFNQNPAQHRDEYDRAEQCARYALGDRADDLDEIIEALSPLPSAVSEPSGEMVLVPREPTAPIVEALHDALMSPGYIDAAHCQRLWARILRQATTGTATGADGADEIERLNKLFMDTRGRGVWLTEAEYAALSAAPSEPERGGSRPSQSAAARGTHPDTPTPPIPETGEA